MDHKNTKNIASTRLLALKLTVWSGVVSRQNRSWTRL